MAAREYVDFDPTADWATNEGVPTYRIHLPDFKKEHLRVQLSPSRLLRISGERPLGDKNTNANKWKRFVKEIRVPPDCDTKLISAKFENGILSIRQPKLEALPPPAPAATVAPSPPQEKEKGKPAPDQQPTNEEDKAQIRNGKAEDDDEGGRKKNEKEAIIKRKEEEKERISGEGGKSGIFTAIRTRPEKLKKLVITAVLALGLALLFHYTFVKRIQLTGEGDDQEL